MVAHLPEEIIAEILLKLPVKSLSRFKCVSKSWLFFISSYKFAKAHLEFSTKNRTNITEKLIVGPINYLMELYTATLHSTAEEDSVFSVAAGSANDGKSALFRRVSFDCPFVKPHTMVKLLGSCNGLVCVSSHDNVFVLWNPATGKSRVLPNSGADEDFDYRISISYVFGYDELHDDYKVVEHFCDDVEGVPSIGCKVYSMRSNSWKTLSNWPGGYAFDGSGVFVNGAVHWLAFPLDKPLERVIVSYDLAMDSFTVFPIPSSGDEDSRFDLKFLGGFLALCCENGVCADAWMMKEYGVKESWTKVIHLPPFFRDYEFFTPELLSLPVDGKILINCGKSIRIYDSGNTHSLISSSADQFVVEATAYVESLISPNLDDEIILGRLLAKNSM